MSSAIEKSPELLEVMVHLLESYMNDLVRQDIKTYLLSYT